LSTVDAPSAANGLETAHHSIRELLATLVRTRRQAEAVRLLPAPQRGRLSVELLDKLIHEIGQSIDLVSERAPHPLGRDFRAEVLLDPVAIYFRLKHTGQPIPKDVHDTFLACLQL
jgi:hypothetical protein